jgi:hypothetical protein
MLFERVNFHPPTCVHLCSIRFLAIFLLTKAQESPHRRSFFYVGGQYINTSAGHVLQDQMYVEQLSPIGGSTKPYPIVFIHGGAQTGTVYSFPPLDSPKH